MKTATLHGPRDLRIERTSPPVPGPGDVRVRVTMAGLCGTDYSIWSGARVVRYPRIMGHELVGRVEAAGPDVAHVREGDPVVIEPNYSCGACPLCREGNRNLCLARTAVGIDVDGGFAELVRVPSRCCWLAPANVSDEALLVTEPLAVVVRAVNRAGPRAGQTAAVVGAGTLGLLALQVLRARGLRVLVVSRTPRRFALARALGAEATHAIQPAAATPATGAHGAEGAGHDETAANLERAAREFSGREGADVVVETAGTADAVSHALALVRPGGRVVLTGLPHEPTPVRFFSVVRREVTVLGSMIYQDEFGEALGLVAAGAVQAAPLLTHRFGLDALGEAFIAHRDPASIKVAITIP
jgi:L-iditol 2-dehydrogenase